MMGATEPRLVGPGVGAGLLYREGVGAVVSGSAPMSGVYTCRQWGACRQRRERLRVNIASRATSRLRSMGGGAVVEIL
jgi:hypothetical protein